MKKYSFLFLTMMAVLWGCSDDNNSKEGGETPEEPSVEISAVSNSEGSEVYATSATFNLRASGVESYAYQIVEGEKTDSPAGEIIYAGATEEGASGITELKEGDNKVTIYGLEGNKTYTVFFAFKADKEYILKSQVITTPAYTRMITVIETKPYSIKVHFEMPKDTYYRFAFGPRDNWQSMKDQFHQTDGDFLSYGQLRKGPQTIEIVNDGYLEEDPDPEWDSTVQVLPGYPYVLLLGECDAEGNVLCEYDNEDPWGGDLLKSTRSVDAPLANGYTEECPDEGVTFNGKYAKQYLYGGSTLIESKISVENIKMTQRSATFAIRPDESVVKYVVSAFTEEDYNYCLTLCSERGLPTFMLTNNEMLSDAQEMSTNPDYLPLEYGKNYKLVVVGTYNEDFSIQSIQTLDFTPMKSNLPDAELEITAKEDPDGNPWMVWFNIKAPAKNCSYIKYLMNYEKEWIPMLNSGTSKEELMLSYGQYLKDAEIIQAINSDKGYDIGFSSWENTLSRLMVASFNEDEKMAVYEGTSKSLAEPDKERVESPLFENLKGDWTATCTLSNNKPVSFKVTIDDKPEQGPASVNAMNQDNYNALLNYFKNSAIQNGKNEAEAESYAKTKVAELFDEYKAEANRYAGKYRGQNRLVGLGFDAAHEYKSSWELFNDLEYSAYDTEELFYDYGPKLFLEVSKENGQDKVELAADPNTVAPLSAWQYYDYYLLGYNSVNFNNAPKGNFPVTVSEDKNTITIGGLEADGKICYPSPAYYLVGTYYTFGAEIISPITLTKGWTEPANKVAPTAKATKSIRNDNDARHTGNRFMRTRLPWTKDGILPLMQKGTIKPAASLKENIQKKAAELHAKMSKKH